MSGKTALIYAVEKNGIEGAIALLEAGASVNVVISKSLGGPGPLTSQKMTPLDLAEHLSHTELAEYLRQYGAKSHAEIGS